MPWGAYLASALSAGEDTPTQFGSLALSMTDSFLMEKIAQHYKLVNWSYNWKKVKHMKDFLWMPRWIPLTSTTSIWQSWQILWFYKSLRHAQAFDASFVRTSGVKSCFRVARWMAWNVMSLFCTGYIWLLFSDLQSIQAPEIFLNFSLPLPFLCTTESWNIGCSLRWLY